MDKFNTNEVIETRDANINMPEEIIVFSHLRWDFVYQRPQHILTRFSKKIRITFIEEPVYDAQGKSYYTSDKRNENLTVLVPHISTNLPQTETNEVIKALFSEYIKICISDNYAFWYYTPMALEFSRNYDPDLVIYDCMDELSAFKFAPDNIRRLEQELLSISDLVFTGGYSLYEAKKEQHDNIYSFPSAIEKEHFALARTLNKSDNLVTSKPTLGFYGVIDERFDINLISAIADQRPDWKIVLIGPVVKIDPQILPKNENIEYAGSRSYQDLPACISSWNVALIPFLLNESTRFISPTKTPEYLAAGLPVVSTAITDVITPYGNNQLVAIAHTADDFITEIERLINMPEQEKEAWQKKVDTFLSAISWDKTCDEMYILMTDVWKERNYTFNLQANV